MRNLRRNLQPVFYKNYEGQEEIYDSYGYPTGNYIPKYSELKSAMLRVSPNKGTSEGDLFGTLANYDRTMSTSDTALDIDENSVLWLDGAETTGPWNYRVAQVGKDLNSISYAIYKVDVNTAQSELKIYTDGLAMKEKLEHMAQDEQEQEDEGHEDTPEST